MPTSQPRTLSRVHCIVKFLQPRSIIDIGVGHGKTGVIVREYLEVMQERYKREEWKAKIYGVEVFGEYRNPIWDYAYDCVHICDALEGLEKLPDVDLIIALDVWEHFDRRYALKVLEACLEKAGYLLLCTPKDPLPQGDAFGNRFERHVSKWTPCNFYQVPYRLITCTSDDWIILLSSRREVPAGLRRVGSPLYRLWEGMSEAVSLCSQLMRLSFTHSSRL